MHLLEAGGQRRIRPDIREEKRERRQGNHLSLTFIFRIAHFGILFFLFMAIPRPAPCRLAGRGSLTP
jgi:hypothetical protein